MKIRSNSEWAVQLLVGGLGLGGLGLREVVLEGLEHLGENLLDLAGALRVP